MGVGLQKTQMLYEISILAFKMATARHLVASPVGNPFILQHFIAFAVPGFLLMVFVGIVNYRLLILFF